MRQVVCEAATVATTDGATTVASAGTKLYGIVLRDDGSNDASVTIKDGTTTKLTYLLKATTTDCKEFNLPVPLKFTGNMVVTVTGTGADCDVLFGQ